LLKTKDKRKEEGRRKKEEEERIGNYVHKTNKPLSQASKTREHGDIPRPTLQ